MIDLTLCERLFSLSTEMTHRGDIGSETVKAGAVRIKRMQALAEGLADHAGRVVRDGLDSGDSELLRFAEHVSKAAWDIVREPAKAMEARR